MGWASVLFVRKEREGDAGPSWGERGRGSMAQRRAVQIAPSLLPNYADSVPRRSWSSRFESAPLRPAIGRVKLKGWRRSRLVVDCRSWGDSDCPWSSRLLSCSRERGGESPLSSFPLSPSPSLSLPLHHRNHSQPCHRRSLSPLLSRVYSSAPPGFPTTTDFDLCASANNHMFPRAGLTQERQQHSTCHEH